MKNCVNDYSVYSENSYIGVDHAYSMLYALLLHQRAIIWRTEGTQMQIGPYFSAMMLILSLISAYSTHCNEKSGDDLQYLFLHCGSPQPLIICVYKSAFIIVRWKYHS